MRLIVIRKQREERSKYKEVGRKKKEEKMKNLPTPKELSWTVNTN